VAAVVAGPVVAGPVVVAVGADELWMVGIHPLAPPLLESNSDNVAMPIGNGTMLNATNQDVPAAVNARPRFVITALFVAALIVPLCCAAEDSGQRVFPTPGAAMRALFAAAKGSNPQAEIVSVLGPDASQLLSSGDPVADDNARKNFLSHYNEMHRLAYDTDGRVILYSGANNWPFPIPLVKKNNGWMFDTAGGEKELLFRRIGANELFTIDVLHNLVDAQIEYATQARGRSGAKQYAQKILSDKDQRNGLYWPVAQGEPESPIGPLIAMAVTEGYKRGAAGQPTPFHGYVYRVLTGQGKDAPGGVKSYLVKGRMTKGFAFLAYPIEYRASGVMTFMVSEDGIVVQKDLGPDTARIAGEMTRYDPDSTWEEAEPETAPDTAAQAK